MTAKGSAVGDEAQIRAVIDEWADGVRTKNVDRCMASHAQEILLFDLPPPLQYTGAQAYRKGLEGWFASFEGPIGYDTRDLQISVGENVAFCHSLSRIRGKRTNGEKTDVWIRNTVGFLKINGKWLVTHEHASVPFYMDGSYKAAVDLQP